MASSVTLLCQWILSDDADEPPSKGSDLGTHRARVRARSSMVSAEKIERSLAEARAFFEDPELQDPAFLIALPDSLFRIVIEIIIDEE